MDIREYYNRFKCSREFNRLKEYIINGEIPAPTKATIELTMRCNLNCQMCFRDAGQKEELDTEQVKTLIADGSNVNGQDENGETALMAAAYNNNVEIVNLMIEYGADVNASDDMNRTVLKKKKRRGQKR